MHAAVRFPRPMPLRSNSPEAWGFALAIFLLALTVRFAFGGFVNIGIPYLTFVPAIVFVTYFSGLWPAISVGAASVLAAWYFFLFPQWSWALGAASVISLTFFAAVSAIDIFIVFIMRSALTELDAERLRSAALAEQRETLFRELQHRVSNNLAIVSALLNLQRSEIGDEKARQALAEAATRLALIGKIDRRLRDPAGAQVHFGPFVQDLCRDVLEASGASDVDCQVTAAEVTIAEDKLVPLALIVTELISNALEHGFADRPEVRYGSISARTAPSMS